MLAAAFDSNPPMSMQLARTSAANATLAINGESSVKKTAAVLGIVAHAFFLCSLSRQGILGD